VILQPPGPVAVATCHVDEDWPPLHRALEDRGVEAALAVWDDPAVDWSRFALVVVRGTWDHIVQPGRYLAWIGEVSAATNLANPPEVIRWNLDKRYLAELAAGGVAVVPTRWLGPDKPWDGDPWDGAGAGEIVVKPAISGGGMDTARYRPAERAAAAGHVHQLRAGGRTVMIQPYQPAVDDEGEVDLVFVDGRYSHAVRKGPLLVPGVGAAGLLAEHEDVSPATPTPRQVEVAGAVVDVLHGRFGAHPLYCRVDLVHGVDGDPLVLEAELIDPSLFLDLAPGSAERLAGAIALRARAGAAAAVRRRAAPPGRGGSSGAA
jgi:hypothetical protein